MENLEHLLKTEGTDTRDISELNKLSEGDFAEYVIKLVGIFVDENTDNGEKIGPIRSGAAREIQRQFEFKDNLRAKKRNDKWSLVEETKKVQQVEEPLKNFLFGMSQHFQLVEPVVNVITTIFRANNSCYKLMIDILKAFKNNKMKEYAALAGAKILEKNQHKDADEDYRRKFLMALKQWTKPTYSLRPHPYEEVTKILFESMLSFLPHLTEEKTTKIAVKIIVDAIDVNILGSCGTDLFAAIMNLLTELVAKHENKVFWETTSKKFRDTFDKKIEDDSDVRHYVDEFDAKVNAISQ